MTDLGALRAEKQEIRDNMEYLSGLRQQQRNRLRELNVNVKETKISKVTVSDHAILRYLVREGIISETVIDDVKKHLAELAEDKNKNLVTRKRKGHLTVVTYIKKPPEFQDENRH